MVLWYFRNRTYALNWNCLQFFIEFKGLDVVGIFRIAGSARRCKHLRKILEGSSTPNLPLLEGSTPHDVATLLKEYFRDLPEPLLPNDYYQAFIAASS